MNISQEFSALVQSDLSCAGAEAASGVITWFATVSLAHFGIGIAVSAFVLFRGYSVAWLWVGMAVILVKEVAFDIPNSGYSILVAADSVWDLFCYLLGFFVQWWAMASDEEAAE